MRSFRLKGITLFLCIFLLGSCTQKTIIAHPQDEEVDLRYNDFLRITLKDGTQISGRFEKMIQDTLVVKVKKSERQMQETKISKDQIQLMKKEEPSSVLTFFLVTMVSLLFYFVYLLSNVDLGS